MNSLGENLGTSNMYLIIKSLSTIYVVNGRVNYSIQTSVYDL